MLTLSPGWAAPCARCAPLPPPLAPGTLLQVCAAPLPTSPIPSPSPSPKRVRGAGVNFDRSALPLHIVSLPFVPSFPRQELATPPPAVGPPGPGQLPPRPPPTPVGGACAPPHLHPPLPSIDPNPEPHGHSRTAPPPPTSVGANPAASPRGGTLSVPERSSACGRPLSSLLPHPCTRAPPHAKRVPSTAPCTKNTEHQRHLR